MRIDREEFLRYLGWKGQQTDDAFSQKLDEAAKKCLELASPRCAVRKFALTPDFELAGTGVVLIGKDIRAHLAGCNEAYLMAATIGAAAERETARLSRVSAYEALLFDTAGSCAIESYCDDVCDDLQASCGKALTSRFSCGYGDFPLEAQRDICRILRTDSQLGLCCDESFLLTPRKSVTALIGVTGSPAPEKSASARPCGGKCAHCAKRDCAYRKN